MNNFKIFIINLEKSVNRRVKLEKQFDKYNVTNYEFVNAINGEELINEKLIELPKHLHRSNPTIITNAAQADVHLLRGIQLKEEYLTHFSPNEIACVRSHIKVIEHAKTLNLDFVIILEDDVIICEDWNKRLNMLMKIVPKNWTHIYLSGMPDESVNKFHPLNFAPFLHVEKSINTEGAFSYILKKEVYDAVLDNLKNIHAPADTSIKELIENNTLTSYTFYPFLSYHDNDIRSDIWEKEYNVDHDSKRYFVNKM